MMLTSASERIKKVFYIIFILLDHSKEGSVEMRRRKEHYVHSQSTLKCFVQVFGVSFNLPRQGIKECEQFLSNTNNACM